MLVMKLSVSLSPSLISRMSVACISRLLKVSLMLESPGT